MISIMVLETKNKILIKKNLAFIYYKHKIAL